VAIDEIDVRNQQVGPKNLHFISLASHGGSAGHTVQGAASTAKKGIKKLKFW
jgi:hypothetical protein